MNHNNNKVDTLPAGTKLQEGKYVIEKSLGNGGFGITYLARQPMINRLVAVKEFFPKKYCSRSSINGSLEINDIGNFNRFKVKFKEEAELICEFESNNFIVNVYDIFEQNNTFYYTMRYANGGDLDAIVEKYGALDEKIAVRYIKQLAQALDYIHSRKILHLDVKPKNILLDSVENGDDYSVVLIDFGFSKRYGADGYEEKPTLVGRSEGYSSLELYKKFGTSYFCRAIDIYSLGATFYKMLTGITPPKAENIGSWQPRYDRNVSENSKNLIRKSLQSELKNRPQDISEFLALLDSEDIGFVVDEREVQKETEAYDDDLVSEIDRKIEKIKGEIEKNRNDAKAKEVKDKKAAKLKSLQDELNRQKQENAKKEAKDKLKQKEREKEEKAEAKASEKAVRKMKKQLRREQFNNSLKNSLNSIKVSSRFIYSWFSVIAPAVAAIMLIVRIVLGNVYLYDLINNALIAFIYLLVPFRISPSGWAMMLVVEAIDKDKDNWWFVIGYVLVGIGFLYCYLTGSYPSLMGLAFWAIVLSVALYSIVKLSGIILTRDSSFSVIDSAAVLIVIFSGVALFLAIMRSDKEYESYIFDENKNLVGVEFRNYATYRGDMSYSILEIKGVPSGKGEITYPDGQSQEVVYDLGKTDKKSLYLYDENGDLRSFTVENREIKYDYAIYQGDVITNGTDRIRSGQGQLTYTSDITFEMRVLNFFKGKSGNVFKKGDYYTGQWVDDKMCGKGTYAWANGDRYDGDFVDDLFTGKGTLLMANGDRFEGEFVDGKIRVETKIKETKSTQNDISGSGKSKDVSVVKPIKTDNSGTKNNVESSTDKGSNSKSSSSKSSAGSIHTFANGDTFTGKVVDGKPSGQGIYTFTNGTIYDGGFANGKYTGKGKLTWGNGNQYIGDFVDGIRQGNGVYVWDEGNKYIGGWSNNQFNGKGIRTWDNGNKYDGDFLNGKHTGKAIFTWANNDRYEGDFIDGKRVGIGTYTWGEGNKYTGSWSNDKFHGQGVIAWGTGNKYEGNFAAGNFSGKGVYTWASGEKYDGYWLDNLRHGSGISILKNGTKYSEMWENGEKKSSTKM